MEWSRIQYPSVSLWHDATTKIGSRRMHVCCLVLRGKLLVVMETVKVKIECPHRPRVSKMFGLMRWGSQCCVCVCEFLTRKQHTD